MNPSLLKTNPIFLITFVVLAQASGVSAQGTSPDLNKLLSEDTLAINPFVSKLPPEPTQEVFNQRYNPPAQQQRSETSTRSRRDPYLESQLNREQATDTETFKTFEANLNISGLIWNSDRPQAIINGQIVDVGDEIIDFKIVNIRKEGVDIDYHGQIRTITP